MPSRLSNPFANPQLKARIFHLGVFLIIVLIGAVIYRNCFKVPFLFDDNSLILDNAVIRSLTDLRALWFYDPSRFLTTKTGPSMRSTVPRMRTVSWADA